MTEKERQLHSNGLSRKSVWWPMVCFGMAIGGQVWMQFQTEQGPAVPVSPSASEFSLQRAQLLLKTLFGDELPHPAGSPQNDIIRNRLVDTLSQWGFEVEVQETRGVPMRWSDAEGLPLENLIFRRRGTAPDAEQYTIAIVAHYDSTPYGPGIADDAVGTCVVLEIARMLSEMPAPRNDLLFLLTDGEEYGLLGATQFIAEHPLAEKVALAINVEARGTNGRSLMFQASPENRWLISTLAGEVRHPASSSLFVEVYKYLPNNTDFTRFLEAGVQGYNFAFIGGAENYHTENDSIASISPASFQHHGENVWALVSRLMNEPFELEPQGTAIYFDLWGRWLVWWPAEWTLPWALVLLGLIVLSALVGMRGSHNESVGRLALSGVLVGSSLLLAGLLAGALAYGLTFQKLIPWSASPQWIVIGLWLAGFAGVAILVSLFEKGVAVRSVLWVSALLWCVFSVALAWFLPGASYLAIVPASAGGIAVLLTGWLGRSSGAEHSAGMGQNSAALVFAVMVAGMWVPLEFLFYQAFGLGGNFILAGRIAVVATSWCPLLLVLNKNSLLVLAATTAAAAILSLVLGILWN